MKRRTFGATWWGRAWLDALEHRARLDPNRLPRGRTYARTGRVLSVRLEQGEIVGSVRGSRLAPYTVRVGVRTFTAAEWQRLLAAIVAKAGHAAALLDGDLEPGIVDDARAVGIELLPGPGELRPRCSCPDWADPCKHAAAVCYLAADELDEDPFALLELRGRRREEVLAALRQLRRGDRDTGRPAGPGLAGSGPAQDRGVAASEAWRRSLAVLPAEPHAPSTPARPAPWPIDPPPGVGVTAQGLSALARDAVGRAWQMVQGDGDSGLALSEEADLARRAAAAVGTDDWPGLAARSGVAATELARRAEAWRHGGEAGLVVLDEGRWRPPTSVMVAAREAVAGARGPGRAHRVTVEANRISVDTAVQLRLGRDGRWYRFEKRSGRWELAAAPAEDIEDLLGGP
jgi:uncharacterized Zn finger protein